LSLLIKPIKQLSFFQSPTNINKNEFSKSIIGKNESSQIFTLRAFKKDMNLVMQKNDLGGQNLYSPGPLFQKSNVRF